jgi:type 1 glutamine amidotransferase
MANAQRCGQGARARHECRYAPNYVTALTHLVIPLPPAYTIQTLSTIVHSNIKAWCKRGVGVGGCAGGQVDWSMSVIRPFFC